MSSFLIATSANYTTDALLKLDSLLAMFSVAAFYLGLGYLFYRIDIGAGEQCNKWRSLILCLSKEGDVTSRGMEDLLSKRKEDFLSKPGAKIVYRWAFSLMLGMMGIYLTQVLGNSPYMLWSSVARVAVPPTSDL